jgi:YidC/Oxa1 family membrane protein insertase
MEKNVILAIVLSMTVLIVYSVFFMPRLVEEKPPETPQEKVKEEEIIPPEEKEITLKNPNIAVTINRRGEIISWYLENKKKELLQGGERALRFYLGLPEGETLSSEEITFKVEEREERKVTLFWEDKERKVKITQILQLPEQGYHAFYNLFLDSPLGIHYSLHWPTKIGEKIGDEERLAYWNFYLYREKKEGVKSEYDSKVKWLGIRQKGDFLITLVPLQAVERGIFKIDYWGFTTTKQKSSWVIYAGPQSYTELRLVNNFVKATLGKDYHLTDAVKVGFWGYLSLGLVKTLIFFYSFTQSYGIAIILLTLLIYGVLSPLTFKQFESMQKMQVIQPELREVQKKFKNDPKKLQAEMMKIYSKHKINPMAGCLPMIVQLPIIFILYRALLDFNFAENPSFLWIKNLGNPDIPLLLGLGATMFLQQKISQRLQPAREQEGIAKMMQFFPLFLIFILWSLPSGVMLYWFTSTLISILQQFFIAKKTATIVRRRSTA